MGNDRPWSSEPWHRLVTADGSIGLALHRFSHTATADPATHDPTTPVVLISHATGFHAHCYQPVAAALPPDWLVVGVDHRGHGYTAADPTSARLSRPPTVDWGRFGDDILTVTEWLRDETGAEQIIGFGHSMGASALTLASARRPDWFSHLVLFEPISPSGFIDPDAVTDDPYEDNSLAAGAIRRRRSFESIDAAVDNYSAKPPFSLVRPEVLHQYVWHGFAPSDDGVTLRCTPEFESATFVSAIDNGVWESLPDAATPTTVAAGAPAPNSPGIWAPAIAERMPNANLHVFEDQTHFGPFTHPEGCAEIIIECVAGNDTVSHPRPTMETS